MKEIEKVSSGKVKYDSLTGKSLIALRTDPKNRTSHGRPPARLRQTLTEH